MSKSVLKPPTIQDNATKIAIDELYRQVNKLLTSISANAQNYGNEVLEGSVRAIYEGKDNFRIEGKTSAGWASVTAQAQGRGNLYKNSPKIDSNGRLNINNVIYGKQNLELHSGKTIKLNATGNLTLDAASIYLDSGNGRFYFYNNGDTDDYMRLNVNASGSILITTYDSDGAEGHYSIVPDGKIKLGALDGAADSIQCNLGVNTFASFAAEDGSYSQLRLYENGGESSDDYLEIKCEEHGAATLSTIDAAGAQANITVQPNGDFKVDAIGVEIDASTGLHYFMTSGTTKAFFRATSLNLAEAANAHSDAAGYGQVWVKSDTPNNLYFTDDTGQDVQITNNGSLAASGGTPRFHFVTGGYITNKTSTTTYYFQYRPLGESWNNAEASPTSINAYDLSAALWIAPAAGKITNITVQGYTNDTGATDPFKFYIFSGTPTHNATSTTLSSFLTTSAITGSAARNLRYSEDFTSSNTFSAGDTFYVMWKKDSNSGNQDFYFSLTVSGEYT